MAEHKVPIVQLTILPHENADSLEIAQVGGYQSVVRKGQYKTGELAAYIPEASIVPDDLLKELGLDGKLAGSKKNRVKAIRLRGVLSQGLIVPLPDFISPLDIGRNMAEHLGVTKYEPPISPTLSGEIYNVGMGINFDVENIKGYPDVFTEGDPVLITEKIHGTFCQVGMTPDGEILIASKSPAARGQAFIENDTPNVYQRAITPRIREVLEVLAIQCQTPVFLLGEVFGNGIQDLAYGATARSNGEAPGFRAFDLYLGIPGQGAFTDAKDFFVFCESVNLPTVPLLYEGPFNMDTINDLTNGRETVSGKEEHIREGVVIRPAKERRDPILGRVLLKSVSGDYLTRKGGTEYN